MKPLLLLFLFLFSADAFAQHHTPLPHGMVFGTKPDTSGIIEASKTEAFMGKKIRISTTVRGKVIRVSKQKGGWFDLDAGNGKIIAAHFKNYNVTIPTGLQGKIVIAQGVAAKQIIADDMQHFAGDTVVGKKQHPVKTDPKRRLIFEVTGLIIEK
jgi:hypothetical protein